MKLVVATRGRPTKQITAKALIDAGLDVIFALTKDDPKPDLPCSQVLRYTGDGGLTAKRNFIMDELGEREKFVVFDDDLRFQTHREGARYTNSTPAEVAEMMQTVWATLDHYPLVGITHRFVARLQPRPLAVNHKVYHMIGQNFSLVPGDCPRFRLTLSQDTDMNIQILTRGLQTAACTNWCRDEKPDLEGGCSIYRTEAMRGAISEQLAKLWPGIVTVTATGGHRVSWKAAIAQGKKS